MTTADRESSGFSSAQAWEPGNLPSSRCTSPSSRACRTQALSCRCWRTRTRAISTRIPGASCGEQAVRWRPWLMTLAPVSIRFSRRDSHSYSFDSLARSCLLTGICREGSQNHGLIRRMGTSFRWRATRGALRIDFDCRPMRQFCGSAIASDAGLGRQLAFCLAVRSGNQHYLCSV
jgi:hypothetical protein